MYQRLSLRVTSPCVEVGLQAGKPQRAFSKFKSDWLPSLAWNLRSWCGVFLRSVLRSLASTLREPRIKPHSRDLGCIWAAIWRCSVKLIIFNEIQRREILLVSCSVRAQGAAFAHSASTKWRRSDTLRNVTPLFSMDTERFAMRHRPS
jgi:hypothetical protein